MVVFETTIDTTFLCFLIDEENNGNKMFASKNLQEIVGRYQHESTQQANHIHEVRSREVRLVCLRLLCMVHVVRVHALICMYPYADHARAVGSQAS